MAAETGLRGFDAAFDAAVKLYVGMCGKCGGGKCGSEEKFQAHGLSFFEEELCADCIGFVRKQVTILAKSDRSFDDALFTRRRCANGVVHRPRNQYCHHEAPCPRGGRTRADWVLLSEYWPLMGKTIRTSWHLPSLWTMDELAKPATPFFRRP